MTTTDLALLPPHMSEEWRIVPLSRGTYDVSNLGRVRSWYRQAGKLGIVMRDEPLVLNPIVAKTGYRVFAVRDLDGKRHLLTVHRQVALAFLGEPPEGKPFALHIDGVKTNNALSNLRWGSPRDNWDDAVGHGTMKIGVEGFRVVSDEQVTEVRSRHASGESQGAISRDLGISRATVSRVVAASPRSVA